MLSFGVSAWHMTTGEAWRDDAARFEAAGYDTLWVSDHIGHIDPFPALVAAGDATERMRLGTYVLNIGFWNPLLLARAVATTATLTGGRLVLGLGAGHAAVEFAQAGLRYPPVGERVGDLGATLDPLRRLLAGQTVDDERLGLVEAATGLPPVEVPLLVGGNGDRVLSLAGRQADVVGLTGFTAGTGRVHTNLSHWGWDGLADRLAHARSAAEAAGRSVTTDVLVQRAAVTDDPEAALADFLEGGLDPAMLDSPFLLVGGEDELVAKVDRLDGLGIDGVTVFGRDADAFAPVVSLLRDRSPASPRGDRSGR